MKTVIFANGFIQDPLKLKPLIQADAFIIAADGGGKYCRMMDLIPDVVIGDLDSLPQEDLKYFKKAGTKIMRFPLKKDETDLELALRYAVEQNPEEIILIGAFGGRWDMSFANLLLIVNQDLCRCQITFLEEYQRLFPIFSHTVIQGKPGDTVSLIPLLGDAQEVITTGLEYPLREETLPYGSPRGVSNMLLGNKATISLSEGLLLCVVTDQEYFISHSL
ncbi:MAG: thiamine diphosphokinase [Anaerolineales bacterium]|nr:thiamine diphosphokinase [Anaerolineales bacterium]